MNLANKSFKDIRTGEIVRVIDSFENIAILENKTKVDTRRLMDTNYYTEYIDPNQFLQSTTTSAYNSIFETIKSIPTDKIPMDDESTVVVNPERNEYMPEDNSMAVVMSSLDDERAEIAKKYGVLDNQDAIKRQNESFSRLLGEEEEVQKLDVVRDNSGQVVSSGFVETTEKIVERVQEKDPYEMFRGIKRNVEFKLDLPLTNNIPKLQFIEMMEESYDKSIIEFLAHDITEEILSNPKSLRDSIEAKIRDMVYGVSKTVKKTAPKRQPKPNTAVGEKPGYKKPTTKKKTEIKEELSTKPIAKSGRKKQTEEQ
jgi:hypothetical protein